MVAVQDPNRFMDTSKTASEESKAGPSGSLNFDLLAVPLVIHYRIKDVAQYGYGRERCYLEPKRLLESIGNRETIHYCAHSHLDELMGPGRDQTARYLKKAIQSQADTYEMGIKILFVGLGSIHPPVAVAEDFEKVVSALQDKQAEILRSQGEASETLTAAKGASFVLQSEAQAYQYERSRVAEAEANRFTQQIKAYEEGGSIYLEREYLSLLDELLPGRRKYVMDSDHIDSWVYEFDMKEKLQPDLFRNIKIPTSEQESTK